MSESDIAQALKIIVEYAQGKGQLPRLDRFIIFLTGLTALSNLYNIDSKSIIDLDK